jgi:hypothetical protein
MFLEGEGDVTAAPTLVSHLLTEQNAWDTLFLDPDPFRVGELGGLAKDDGKKLIRLLKAAAKRKNLGGILLLVDGDLDRFQGAPFCGETAAYYLSERAREAGGGAHFSLASVIAIREYESWLIGGIEALTGKALPDGRRGIRAGTTAPAGNIELAPRGAKAWLSQNMESGYKPTVDQGPLTKLLDGDFAPLRNRQLRSFRRLENAIKQLIDACRTGRHVVTPQRPPGRS